MEPKPGSMVLWRNGARLRHSVSRTSNPEPGLTARNGTNDATETRGSMHSRPVTDLRTVEQTSNVSVNARSEAVTCNDRNLENPGRRRSEKRGLQLTGNRSSHLDPWTKALERVSRERSLRRGSERTHDAIELHTHGQQGTASTSATTRINGHTALTIRPNTVTTPVAAARATEPGTSTTTSILATTGTRPTNHQQRSPMSNLDSSDDSAITNGTTSTAAADGLSPVVLSESRTLCPYCGLVRHPQLTCEDCIQTQEHMRFQAHADQRFTEMIDELKTDGGIWRDLVGTVPLERELNMKMANVENALEELHQFMSNRQVEKFREVLRKAERLIERVRELGREEEELLGERDAVERVTAALAHRAAQRTAEKLPSQSTAQCLSTKREETDSVSGCKL